MSLAEATTLKPGGHPIQRRVARMPPSLDQCKAGVERKHCVNMFGVTGPVGGNKEVAVLSELLSNLLKELQLDNPPLAMALLRPGIGKIQVDPIKRTVSNLARQYVNRIVRDNPQIGGTLFLGLH